MNITKQQCQEIDAEIDAAVNAILEKHGLQKTKRRSTYGDFYRYTIEAAAVLTNEEGVNLAAPEAIAWIANAPMLGFRKPEEALGSKFSYAGRTFFLIGFRPRARKHPIVARSEADGKTYVLPEQAVRFMDGCDLAVSA
jgi:hypothetical protein